MTTRTHAHLTLAALACAQLLAVRAAHASCPFPPSDGCAEAGDSFGQKVARGDFNGDGFQDLAVGIPLEDIGSLLEAGAVQVIYGTASGLGVANGQLWSQNSANVEDVAEAGDLFGSSLAARDFNGDGFADLAIGVPEENIGSVSGGGAVNVLYGSPTGLSATFVPDQIWSQNTANIADLTEAGDLFGDSLAAGDLNGDGLHDLAIGAPGEDIGSIGRAGAVNVVYGSAAGLSATFVPNQFWSQNSAFVEDVTEADDLFGFSLAAGDANGDGRDDLAIGVPGEDIGSVTGAGAVNVLYGSPAGLSATFVPDQLWSQDTANVEDVAEAGDLLGTSLAAGDFNGDGRDDLAIGVESEDIGSVFDAGAANVLYGASTGLSATVVADQFWNRNSLSVEDVAVFGDHFGVSLAAGDFNGDGRDDLAAGVPQDIIGSIALAGAVNVIYGSPAGLSATFVPDQFWSQDSASVEEAAGAGDSLGGSLAAGDFNGDGRDELAIGVTEEDLNDASGVIANAGAVNVIYGSSTGLSATVVPDQIWTQIHILPPHP